MLHHTVLPGLGGLPILLNIIEQGEEARLVANAQLVLGIAAANNPAFQMALLTSDSDVVAKLLQVCKGISTSTCALCSYNSHLLMASEFSIYLAERLIR